MNSRMTTTEVAALAGPFDKTGREIMIGDVLKVFHFVHYQHGRHCFMFKQVTGERVWESGYTALRLSHLDMTDDGFYLARDGRHYPDYEIVQGVDADFYERPRHHLLASGGA